jgi:hypothetical protein
MGNDSMMGCFFSVGGGPVRTLTLILAGYQCIGIIATCIGRITSVPLKKSGVIGDFFLSRLEEGDSLSGDTDSICNAALSPFAFKVNN